MLTLRVDQTVARWLARRLTQPPTMTQGIELVLSEPPGARELQLRLRVAGLADVFDVLVSDVATAAAKSTTADQAAVAMVEQHDRWIELLRSLGTEGLSPQARRGLFGELSLLRRLLRSGAHDEVVARSWVGPNRANQDFQLPDTAIEVKTSAGREPQHLVVASERQLDPSSCGTLLLCHLLIDERRGGDGATLNEQVEAVRSDFTSTSARGEFNASLIRVGFLADHANLYDDLRYRVRRELTWRVAGAFPRLVENDLRNGVGSCSYQISTAGLDDYLVSDADFQSLVAQGGTGG